MNNNDNIRNNWNQNKGAIKRVKEELISAGIPLELQVAKKCEEFCRFYNRNKGVHVHTKKIIYDANPSEQEYREIDCSIYIYEEFEVEKPLGIQLSIEIPIECKFRKDVEVFGFPTIEEPSQDYCFGFPLISGFSRSEYFRSLAASYKHLSVLEPCIMTMMDIEDGKTPRKVSEEQLIYKAASSLYDFILFDINEYKNNKSEKNDDPTINKLFEAFKRYIQLHHFWWVQVIREWMGKNIDESHVISYNHRVYGDERVYHQFTAYLPIICINGKIHLVKMDSELNISEFQEKPFLLTHIRKQGWPGQGNNKILLYTPEVAIIVTNPFGLYQVLESGFTWYKNLKKSLKIAPKDIIRRAPIETAFIQKAYQYYKKSEGPFRYRSDLDITNWF